MKRLTQTLSVALVLVISWFPHPAGAAEQAAGPAWVAVGADNAQTPIGVSAAPATGLSQDVALSLPGVLKSPVKGGDGERYIQLSVPGCGGTAEKVGAPVLPFKGFFLEIPYGVTVSVELLKAETVSLGVGDKVYPRQPPKYDDGRPDPPFTIDAEAYAQNRFYPASPVVVGEPGFIRGRRVVFVQAFPLRYNPVTGELQAFPSLALRLTFEGAVDPAGEIRKRRLATEASELLARQLVLNCVPTPPGTALRASEAADGEPVPEVALSGGDGADYLIIVPDALYDEVLPLADWKRRKGFLTRVLKMSEIGTTAADIKNTIQNAYETWTPAPSYVLLVGDSDEVPPEIVFILGFGFITCPTDHSFACVDGTDYYPDLTIGRLPVQTTTECANVIGKVLAYDRNPPIDTWYEAFLSAGFFQDDGDDGEAERWFMEDSAHVTSFLSGVGMTTHTAWCTNSGAHEHYYYNSSGYPHRFPPPPEVPSWVVSLWTDSTSATAAITSTINAGVGLVLHRDHGNYWHWALPPYELSDVAGLANGAKTPVVLSINCLSGGFTYDGGDCFCEAFLKKSPGGCVGIAGATLSGESNYNTVFTHGIFTGLWETYDPTYTDATYPRTWRPAGALALAKYYVLTYMGATLHTEKAFRMYHWFGDPEMRLRTLSPQTLSVIYPSSVAYGVPVDVTVTVQQGGSPAEGARVAISNDATSELWSGLTDPAGSITFSGITLSAQDDYDVVATAHNATPHEGTLTATSSSAGSIHLDKDAYSASSTIEITVVDADLVSAGTQDVTIETSVGGDEETVTLSETPADSGLFAGTIPTGSGTPTLGDDILQVADGETVTATYEDLDNGSGNPATAEDTATVDGVPPVISNVQVVEVTGNWATVSFETDTPTTGRVRCGETCGGPYPFVGEDPNLSTAHTIRVSGLQSETTYAFVVDAWDAADNLTTDDNSGACHPLTTIYQKDYFTEWFESGDNDLAYHYVTFTPDESPDFYSVCWDIAAEFHTDPNGGTVLAMEDNWYEQLSLSGGAKIWLYGLSSGTFHLGSNGYVTGFYPDVNPTEYPAEHFGLPRISCLFDDLDPSAGGTVSWKQLGDRVAVTFEDVPEAGTANSNSFQFELFFDGRIRLTWLGIDATDGLVGLSKGEGIPEDFLESDMSAYAYCLPRRTLTVSIVNPTMGTVELDPIPEDPENPEYIEGTEVTLEAVVIDDDEFSRWVIYDPNFPGDDNYATEDFNNPISLVMDADWEVTAIFKCGSAKAFFPLAVCGLMSIVFLRRWR